MAVRVISHSGKDSPYVFSRAILAGKISSLHMLNLFDKHGIKTIWVNPNHPVKTFPSQMSKVVKHGHEVGVWLLARETPSQNGIAITPARLPSSIV